MIGVIIFGSIRFLSKKITKLNFKKKPKSIQTDRFRFGFLGKNRFKPVWLGFFRVFFGFGLVQFFRLFFSDFFQLNRFFGFFAHP